MSLEAGFATYNTFYDVLDIPPSASPSEVREAYLRAKAAYNKDSVALYSLIDSSEREAMLQRIEEAYDILSNDEKRRQYDMYHGIIETSGIIETTFNSDSGFDNDTAIDSRDLGTGADIVSIDRVPPMEVLGNDDLLNPPSTDFASTPTTPNIPQSLTKGSAEHYTEHRRRKNDVMSTELPLEIMNETVWQGSFIRRVREAQNISLEEISNVTKISKTYIQAIEQEDFKKLPALVFVRGFLVQILRMLKLPQEKALEPYLARFKAAKAVE